MKSALMVLGGMQFAVMVWWVAAFEPDIAAIAMVFNGIVLGMSLSILAAKEE